MTAMLARQILVALLANALLAAPVMASAPTCCGKCGSAEARRASGCPHCSSQSERDCRAQASTCCSAKAIKSCCGKKHAESVALAASQTTTTCTFTGPTCKTSCCCKKGQSLPPTPTGQSPRELRVEPDFSVCEVVHVIRQAQPQSAISALARADLAPGPASQVLLCRWVI